MCLTFESRLCGKFLKSVYFVTNHALHVWVYAHVVFCYVNGNVREQV